MVGIKQILHKFPAGEFINYIDHPFSFLGWIMLFEKICCWWGNLGCIGFGDSLHDIHQRGSPTWSMMMSAWRGYRRRHLVGTFGTWPSHVQLKSMTLDMYWTCFRPESTWPRSACVARGVSTGRKLDVSLCSLLFINAWLYYFVIYTCV
jgi:hypothetical protein